MGILEDMMEAGKDIMNNPGDYLNDPSKILSLLGQEGKQDDDITIMISMFE